MKLINKYDKLQLHAEKQPSQSFIVNIQHDLGHRHKHIAHLIDRGIKLTNSIKIYCKNILLIKKLIKNFLINKIKTNNK